jgi:hypothetical protein
LNRANSKSSLWRSTCSREAAAAALHEKNLTLEESVVLFFRSERKAEMYLGTRSLRVSCLQASLSPVSLLQTSAEEAIEAPLLGGFTREKKNATCLEIVRSRVSSAHELLRCVHKSICLCTRPQPASRAGSG